MCERYPGYLFGGTPVSSWDRGFNSLENVSIYIINLARGLFLVLFLMKITVLQKLCFVSVILKNNKKEK